MELKEQAQQAPLLEVVFKPTHGLLLMELFGSLVVMDMIAPLLLVSVFDSFFFELGRKQTTQTKLNQLRKKNNNRRPQ